MDNANGHTINLANSIIGVGILAMPYCFRQCGIILSIILLLISSVISRLACHFLLKSAIIARRKTFEFLAFHTFGSLGKFAIEIGLIGFLLGTCIAFFVVMGDLGPAIISEMVGVQIGSALRNGTLIGLAVFCVLPLGLLRNVDSLHVVSIATIGFYCCLVLKIIVEALPHIFTGDWISEVVLWQPDGILQCLPIFSMALFCQTQLFEIYQAIPNASLDKMNSMIRVAVNMCTWVYIFVGAFGYIAFFQKPFTGNILLSFNPSIASNVIKMGFVLSLAFSFPLVIFPCRASLFSLLYKGTSYTTIHEGSTSNYIPEGKFKLLTFLVVAIALIIGIMIPSIELVLGLIGSTIGVMICVLFPVTCFICISPKNTNERILAQIMLFVGIIVMVMGTYANLAAVEEASINIPLDGNLAIREIPIHVKLQPEKPVVIDIPTTSKSEIEEKKVKPPDPPANIIPPEEAKPDEIEQKPKEIRHEPPQPEEPIEIKPAVAEVKAKPPENLPNPVEVEIRHEPPQPVEPIENAANAKTVQPDNLEKIDEKLKHPEDPMPQVDKKSEERVNGINANKKIEEVDIEAINKEEAELKKQEKVEKDKSQDLIDTMQKQQEVQRELVEQQKKLIEVLQKQQENVQQQNVDKVKEEKVKAVKEIEDIAKRAIESISGKKANAEEEKNEIIEPVQAQNVAKPEEIKNETKLSMLPLPMALAKLNNATMETKSQNNTLKMNILPLNESLNGNSIRREILSNNDNDTIRAKREISQRNDKIETLDKAVKDFCDDKSMTTEKPLIKILCKLSEPNAGDNIPLSFLDDKKLNAVELIKRYD